MFDMVSIRWKLTNLLSNFAQRIVRITFRTFPSMLQYITLLRKLLETIIIVERYKFQSFGCTKML